MVLLRNKILVIAFLFVVLGSTTSYAEVVDRPSQWAEADVAKAVEKGIVPERLRSNYNQPITREEYAELSLLTTLYISGATWEGIAKKIPGHRFNDINTEAVRGAFALGIINGVSASEFNPRKNLNRQEAAVMIANILRTVNAKRDLTPAFFSDKEAIEGWAVEGVDTCYNAGIMKGTEYGFEPWAGYTREQAIVTMMRTLRYIPSSETVALRGKVRIKPKDIDNMEVYPNRVLAGNYLEIKKSGPQPVLAKFSDWLSPEVMAKLQSAKDFLKIEAEGLIIEINGEDAWLCFRW